MIQGRASELPDYVVFRTVAKYCFIIIVVPVASFFIAKGLFNELNIDSVSSSIYSAAITVVVLHLTLGLYIYRAWLEADKPDKPVKKD